MISPGTLAELVTANNEYVATVECVVPPFQLSEVLFWGTRVFEWINRDQPGAITRYREVIPTVVQEAPKGKRTATVILFKDSGKYYTEEKWTIPEGAIGPYDMEKSPDFRRIGNGAILVETQEPWGYPHLFPSD